MQHHLMSLKMHTQQQVFLTSALQELFVLKDLTVSETTLMGRSRIFQKLFLVGYTDHIQDGAISHR